MDTAVSGEKETSQLCNFTQEWCHTRTCGQSRDGHLYTTRRSCLRNLIGNSLNAHPIQNPVDNTLTHSETALISWSQITRARWQWSRPLTTKPTFSLYSGWNIQKANKRQRGLWSIRLLFSYDIPTARCHPVAPPVILCHLAHWISQNYTQKEYLSSLPSAQFELRPMGLKNI